MNKNRETGTTYANFRAYCPLMIIYSILVLGFVLIAIAGVKLPLDAQTFEGTMAVKVVSVVVGIMGVIAALIGRHAAVTMNRGLLKLCGWLSVLLIVGYCAIMFLSDGHTNPHVWGFMGTTSLIPGSFGGTALRLAAKGWDDRSSSQSKNRHQRIG